MSLSRREFLQLLTLAAAQGLPLGKTARAAGTEAFYDLPPAAAGTATLLHFTDCHAQLQPAYFREPDVNIGLFEARGRPPHLVGEALLRHFRIAPKTRQAYAYTHLDFEHAARRYGRIGGFAHMATLVKRARSQRPGALLLDGGDNWQGSATALWTRGQDMIEASRRLGVDLMTGHWEFTYGAGRVKQAIEQELKGRTEFLAQNVRTADFGDPVFPSHVIREINGVPVAVIGQAFPYTPIANPRHFVADWTFGIQEETLQQTVNDARTRGAWAVVLLSHNGMDVDLKLASRVAGIDVILGGHTHDAVPEPVPVANRVGRTLVTNAGCNGKFLAVLELEARDRRVRECRYRLLPVFSDLIEPDQEMTQLIGRVRAPYQPRLSETLAVTEGLLYRRGNFTGTFDQLILDALMEAKDAEIAFSPGFRWGATLLPGQAITFEDVMNQTAVTYPHVVVSELTGEAIRNILEDVCDNLFNPDPYYQQGGDMVRIGGMSYRCEPQNRIGARISAMTIRGKALEAGKRYKVASWAPVTESAIGEPIWDVVSAYLRAKKVVRPITPIRPALSGVEGNPGLS